MAEQAVTIINAELELLPAVDKPVEQMTLPELLQDTSRLSLLRLRELVSNPIVPYADLKERRLVGDMANAVMKLFVRVAEGEFRQRRTDALEELLAQIAATKD